MDTRAEIREFLATRRAKITPDQAGMPRYGGRRRVPGLRREEAAMLAGVSIDYYTRLEKGHVASVSDEVLDAVACALQLDDAERAHLFDLARAARLRRLAARQRGKPRVRASVQHIFDSATTAAAFVRNRAWTCWPPTPSYKPCTHRSTRTQPGRRTWPGSVSWTRARMSSTPTGTTPRTPLSRCCAPKPAATR